MGIRADIREELKKESVTKIHGQPTSHDLTILEKELIHWEAETLDMWESLWMQRLIQL